MASDRLLNLSAHVSFQVLHDLHDHPRSSQVAAAPAGPIAVSPSGADLFRFALQHHKLGSSNNM